MHNAEGFLLLDICFSLSSMQFIKQFLVLDVAQLLGRSLSLACMFSLLALIAALFYVPTHSINTSSVFVCIT
jgi:hypothetical protein